MVDLPNSNWDHFQPLSPVQAAENQQRMKEINQLGPLQIQTKQQEMNTENALAPYKVQQAGQENDLAQVSYQNTMMADVAQRAQAADPADAPRIWDEGMGALVDKGVGAAGQYVGHYRPDLAEKVTDSFGGGTAAGGGRAARGAGGAGASGSDQSFDADAVSRSIANVPPMQLQKSLVNLNKAISSFNNVKDQDSWNAEMQALKEAGIDPAKFLPSTEWNAMNYATAHRAIQHLTNVRDVVADRVSEMSIGLPGTTPKPLYEPDQAYLGPQQGTNKAVMMDKRTGQVTVSNVAIGPKPSAQIGLFQMKQSAWLSTHPGDTAGALEFANGKRSMDPHQMMTAALNAANKELGDATLTGQVIPDPDAFVREKTAQNYAAISGAAGGPASGTPAPKGGGKQQPRMSQSDVQASVANARAALKRHPDKRGVIIARLRAAGVPTTGL